MNKVHVKYGDGPGLISGEGVSIALAIAHPVLIMCTLLMYDVGLVVVRATLC